MKRKRVAVIMAGGAGERFYPLSRAAKPKQLLRLVNPEKTMIEESIDRIGPLFLSEDIFVITSSKLQGAIRQALPSVPPENIIGEPQKRNTAPCLALAHAVICARYGQEFQPDEITMVVLTADQFMANVETFREQLSEAMSEAELNDVLVTFGVPPSRPETGFGYIQKGELLRGTVHRVKAFREKPNATQANQFLSDGNYLWNSGMFVWRCDYFLSEMTKYCPSVGSQIPGMMNALLATSEHQNLDNNQTLAQIFGELPDLPIDVGLMERSPNVVVIPARFDWDDVGSWDSLPRSLSTDDAGNVVLGLTTVLETTRSVIANYSTNRRVMVSALGMDDVIVVVTDDSVLVCPKHRAQDIKKIVTSLRSSHGEEWL